MPFSQLLRGGSQMARAPSRYSNLQARLIDNQVTDTLANKAGNRLASNVYSKPQLAASLGLGALGYGVLGPGAKASLYGSKGLLAGAANAINPTGVAAGKIMSSSLFNPNTFFGAMASSAAPLKAAVSLPGYALGSGLSSLGAMAGHGMLGSALAGMGATISGGALAPILGTAASLYALKKGGQMATRAFRARGAANRIGALQRGIAPSGYDANMIRDLGLRTVR
jgi:hypothetical protein